MTRVAVAVVRLVVLLVVFRSAVPNAQGRPISTVRGLDAWAIESIERGQQGAAMFRELARGLAGSDLIVHVETSTALPQEFSGLTRLVSDTGAHRYVRITLDRDLAPAQRAAILVHELQHAIELAHSDAVPDRRAAALRADWLSPPLDAAVLRHGHGPAGRCSRPDRGEQGEASNGGAVRVSASNADRRDCEVRGPGPVKSQNLRIGLHRRRADVIAETAESWGQAL